MDLQRSIAACLRNGLRMAGRASRSGFWWSSVAYGAVIVCLVAVVTVIDTVLVRAGSRLSGDYHPIVWLSLAVASVPLLASAVRRLQDVGLPGWLVPAPFALSGAVVAGMVIDLGPPPYENLSNLIWAIALVVVAAAASLILAAVLARPSQPGANTYGPSPQGAFG